MLTERQIQSYWTRLIVVTLVVCAVVAMIGGCSTVAGIGDDLGDIAP